MDIDGNKIQHTWQHRFKHTVLKRAHVVFLLFLFIIFLRLMHSIIHSQKENESISENRINNTTILFTIDLHIGLKQFAQVCLRMFVRCIYNLQRTYTEREREREMYTPYSHNSLIRILLALRNRLNNANNMLASL